MPCSYLSKFTLILGLLVPFVSSTAFVSDKATAKSYKNGYRYLRITSRFNPNKTVTVAVRPSRKGGREVRLPTGRWVHCAGNCRWTVEKEYLDVLRFQQDHFGPGYLRLNIYLD